MNDHTQHTGHLVASGTSGVYGVWAFVHGLAAGAPAWDQIPPVILAITGLVVACNTVANDRARRRAGLAPVPAQPENHGKRTYGPRQPEPVPGDPLRGPEGPRG